MFVIDKYFRYSFHAQTYNCWHFAMEVWKDLTGESLLDYSTAHHTAALSNFTEYECPVEPCIVLMGRDMCTPHVGVYHQRYVLHLHETRGVRYEQLRVASAGFKVIKYYRKKYAVSLDHREPAST